MCMKTGIWKKFNKVKDYENNMKERCVLCGAITPYDRETPIDERLHYVEGCGQLCKNCYENGEDFELINPEKDETY